MDPFTQRMLEKAEQRSRALGISNASKFPLAESASAGDANVYKGLSAQWQPAKQQQLQTQHQNQEATPLLRSPGQSSHASTNTNSTHKQLQVVERKQSCEGAGIGGSSVSPNKVLRQFSAVNKENMDLGIEINIMMDKNVEVEVHVEEQEISENDDEGQHLLEQQQKTEVSSQPLSNIRDTSRNRLQRLGALYSKPEDLSSPIHRTEGKFSAEDADPERCPKKPKQRYGKLAALASTINEWEDDTAHHSCAATTSTECVPPPKPDLPSRGLAKQPQHTQQRAPAPPAPKEIKIMATKPQAPEAPSVASISSASSASTSQSKTKQLKWDPKVINSLEAQGFQRRESNTAKLAFEYADNAENEGFEQQTTQPENYEKLPVAGPKSSAPAGKLTTADIFKQQTENKTSHSTEKKTTANVKTGLVSGRAAAFETKAAAHQQQQRPQKDPTELTLKERMQLFEKNKGDALVPKAAFGMAPPINRIRQDTAAKKDITKAQPSVATTSASASIKPNADSKVRDKVAALVANASTISENKIKADIFKQRQEDMQVLSNRFNRQKEIFLKEQQEQQQKELEFKKQTAQPSAKAKPVTTTSIASSDPQHGSNFVRPPPPPPPLPPTKNVGRAEVAAVNAVNAFTTKRRSPGDIIDDESKRARKSNAANARLYPALSDLESNASYNCGTTATPPHSDATTVDDDEDNVRTKEDDENNCNDSYMDSEEDSTAGLGNNSLGREVLQVVQKNDHQQNQNKEKLVHKHIKEVRYAEKDYYYGDSSINSSEASMGIDDYLDEALGDDNVEDGDDDCTQESDDNEENASRASRESKGTTASNSFSFRKTPKRYSNCHTISEEQDNYQTPTTASNTFTTTQPVKSELSVNREDDNMVTLVHTVSFYRKQQTANSNNSTPVRRICREEQVLRSTPLHGSSGSAHMQYESQQQQHNDEFSEDEDSQSEVESVDDSHLVQEKIKKLLDEVCKQQQVIAQTSQALNLCAATIEFSGSTESVEGERHLLVATHRRQACLDEVQRLRVDKSLRPIGAPREKGRLTVKEITLPLRQDYIRKLAADTISGHHLVCLLKYNEHVLATKTVPTLPGLLAVKFPDVLQLNNVYADFRITLEIYGMTAQREVLPHEVKYHINLNKKSGIKTPKKKGSDNRLVMPPVQSPAGPNVVRTPALVQHGFAIFSLREIQRTTWTLTQVLGFSPLDGAVHMKVNCELSVSVEYKGFLTMFEDVSGFGAWHRRWCYLSGTMLNFWKYPDDEKKKTPIGSIDLYTCSSQKITTAPRDICARLNTMLLECQRPAKETDEESLILVPNGRMTIVRHLLSADTKEEREEWCAYFNKALTLLRAWGPPQ